MSSQPTASFRKIAVLRANGLGDFIFSLPALESLRAAHPQAEIVLLGKAWHAELFRNRSGPVDRVVVIPEGGLGEEGDPPVERAQLERFFAAMAAERFDLAIQLHGGGRHSNPFVRRLGARLTIGMKTPDAPPLDRWIPYIYFQPEVFRYLEVVSLIGVAPVTFEPHLQVTEADIAESLAVVPETGRPLVALHPGASDARRHWPVEKFAAVGDALAMAGATVAVTGTGTERHLVAGVVGAMKAPAHDVCDRLTLGGLLGLLSRCAVVVSNDSGPLHAAVAVGTPTVGIYWCGNGFNGGPLTRGRHRLSLSWQLHCPVCGVNTLEQRCDHQASFVAGVPVEEVTASALDLLLSAPAERAAVPSAPSAPGTTAAEASGAIAPPTGPGGAPL